MRILVVEDEKEIADGIRAILFKAGYEVDVLYDGIMGLTYIRQGNYDLVLLDIMLPGLDGFGVLSKVREEGIDIPIILLTARVMTHDKIKGLDMGADDYLTKPFDAGELLARIRARIRKLHPDNMDRGRVKAFDLTLDSSNYKLLCNDKEIKLSNKEYQLIEYLMINKEIILTREQISAKVWGLEDESEYNSVDVYISFLRKKMKFLRSKAEIITKKGVGYSLEGHD